MAILTAGSEGFVLDHNLFVTRGFAPTEIPLDFFPSIRSDGSQLAFSWNHLSSSFDDPSLKTPSRTKFGIGKCGSCCLRYKQAFFHIETPFMMDSEFKARQKRIAVDLSQPNSSPDAESIGGCVSKKRTRGRKKSIRDDAEHADLLQKFRAMINITSEIWMPQQSITEMDNNKTSRNFAKSIPETELNLQSGRLFGNPADHAVAVRHGDNIYAIPSKSRYISSLFREIDCLLQDQTKYDLIVMDPPWENKSAKRLKTYAYLHNSDLLSAPIPQLASDGAVIAVWVTNNPRLQLYIEGDLFPAWGVKKLTEWTWIKVTKSGESVYPWNSPHKKPYEKLILASFGRRLGPDIPNDLVFISVPSAVHSHKPPLGDVLRPYIPPDGQCLELFARSLAPGWTSWGLEVLKLQNLNLFEKVS